MDIQVETNFDQLSSKRRRIVKVVVEKLADEMAHVADSTSLAELTLAGQAAVDFVRLLDVHWKSMKRYGQALADLDAAAGQAGMELGRVLDTQSKSVGRFGQLLAELGTALEAEQLDEEALEASGRLQALALYRSIEANSLSVRELEAAGISRQRLKQLRDQGRLLGIRLPFQRGYLYPRWQFEKDLRPKSFLPEITSVASKAGIDAITLHQLMTRRVSGRPTLVELCEQGELDKARNALTSYGELGG